MASKKDLLQKRESFRARIREHEQKISAAPKAREVEHWRTELRTFRTQLDAVERQISSGSGFEADCPKCKKEVTARNNKCPRCDTYLA